MTRRPFTLAAIVFAFTALPVMAVDAGITDQQLTDLGNQLEQDIRAGDGSLLSRTLDFDAMNDAAAAGLDLSAGLKEETKKGLKLGNGQMVAQFKGSDSFRFLRVRGPAGDRHLLFRVYGDAGLNYYDMYVDRDNEGKIRIVDMIAATVGERSSQMLRRHYLHVIGGVDNGKHLPLRSAAAEYVKHVDEIEHFLELSRGGKPKEATAIYDALPPAVQNEKMLMLQQIVNAAALKDLPLYIKSIDAYEKAFPNDPGAAIMTLDRYFAEKDFDGALAAIDLLDKSVGGDPILDLLRSFAYEPKKDFPAERKVLNRLIKAEPKFLRPHYMLISLSIDAKDFKETARLLALVESNTTTRFDDLKTRPFYAEFVKSPEFKEWSKARSSIEAAPE